MNLYIICINSRDCAARTKSYYRVVLINVRILKSSVQIWHKKKHGTLCSEIELLCFANWQKLACPHTMTRGISV